MSLTNSLQQLEKDLEAAPSSKAKHIAERIVESADLIDVFNAGELAVHDKYRIYADEDDQVGVKVERDYNNPVEYTDRSVLSAPTGVSFEKPIKDGERWNQDRRASNTGIKYPFNEHVISLNPFLKTGLTGRGLLWQYGPNHAVDNGLLMTKPNKDGVPTLYAIGIHRKDNPGVPYISGGFVKTTETDGRHIIDEQTILISRMEEFFEELVSGSVDLLPDYAARVEEAYKAAVNKRLEQNNEPLKQDKLDEIHEQVVTHIKMQQVRDLDPDFFTRLIDALKDDRECYAGPVMNSNRMTDNAWIETRMFWTELTEEKWQYIRGDNPVFDYQLAAGDDADGVHTFEIGADLIKKSSVSHMPLFSYMAASYLLDAQGKGIELHPNVVAQITEIADVLYEDSNVIRREGYPLKNFLLEHSFG